MSFSERFARLRRRFPLADLPARVATPAGRRMLASPVSWLLWPALAPCATVARRTWKRGATVIAVSGSVGKTTVTRAIAAALERPEPDYNGGNYGTPLARRVLALDPDRPNVLEVGISARGQMRGYARLLAPNVVVMTAVASSHLRSIGDLDALAREKSELVAGLRPGGLAILNGDDPRVAVMAARAPRARVLRCGFGPDNDLRAEKLVHLWPPAVRFELVADGERHAVQLRLLGAPAAWAALFAVAAAREVGTPIPHALERLERLAPTPGRLEAVPLANGAWILADDFKASVDSVREGIATLAALPARRKLVVLGDVEEPPRERERYYRELGETIGRVAMRVVCLGDQADAVRSGARRAGLASRDLPRARDLEEVPELLGELGEGDAVLIKGRADQKLARLVHRLAGVRVDCRLRRCPLLGFRCEVCPEFVDRSASAPAPTNAQGAAG